MCNDLKTKNCKWTGFEKRIEKKHHCQLKKVSKGLKRKYCCSWTKTCVGLKCSNSKKKKNANFLEKKFIKK